MSRRRNGRLHAPNELLDERQIALRNAAHTVASRTLLTLAQFRGDWVSVTALVGRLGALQDKPGPPVTAGTTATTLAQEQAGRRDAAWVQEEVHQRYSAMNRPDVMRNMNMTVPEGLVGSIVGARLQNELIVPLKAPIMAGLQAVIDAQSRAAPAKPDVWTLRQFTIAPNARAPAPRWPTSSPSSLPSSRSPPWPRCGRLPLTPPSARAG